MNLRFTGEKAELEVSQIFNKTMRELIENDSRVVYLDADLMGALKTNDLWHDFPNNVFNVGIQEANMVGVAAGLYLNGFKPYIHSLTPFITRRVFDQLFISIAYANKSLRVIGSDSGIMSTHNGGTHMCFEDIALMRTIPGALIIDVSDPVMCSKFLKSTKDRPGLTYIRMPRRDVPDIYTTDQEFSEGKGLVLKEGEDITIIASGIMVATSLKAANILQSFGINARVIDIVSIKPIDVELIVESAKKTHAVLVAENTNVNGGLYGAVCEVLSQQYPTRVCCIGIKDKFGRVGSEEYLRDYYELKVDNIVDAVRKML